MTKIRDIKAYTHIKFILGDQLNSQHSWYQQQGDTVLFVIAELKQEQAYVHHHAQKQVAFFAAMKAFADGLIEEGHQVLHLTLDETHTYAVLPELLDAICKQTGASYLHYQRPDEYRLLAQLRQLTLTDVTKIEADTEHFMCDFDGLLKQFPSNKSVRLESFYRRMRKQHQILLEQDGEPVGGKWNYDVENRKKLKKTDVDAVPLPLVFANNVSDIVTRLKRHNVLGFGHVDDHLLWPINRNQSLNLLAHFCQICLPLFGTFQDAMTQNTPNQWSIYHSRLSFSLNSKMLSPREVIDAVLAVYQRAPSRELLAQVEGVVRQILGWREYVRGMYWANMPNYECKNHLNHTNSLPSYFWDGNCKMNCVKHAIDQSLEYAYAHHIQRLMITGNFSLLAEIDPKAVHEWYLGIYIDAIEWVELPNTIGMALYADGGLIASKPYVSSGAYINRMSDYCKGCHYNIKQRSGDGACPFNALYWRFMVKHRDTLTRKPRMNMVFRNWDNLAPQEQEHTLQTAESYLQNLADL
ncbi:cryptochrome/photolyase family protein [Vibrio astriarenae]